MKALHLLVMATVLILGCGEETRRSAGDPGEAGSGPGGSGGDGGSSAGGTGGGAAGTAGGGAGTGTGGIEQDCDEDRDGSDAATCGGPDCDDARASANPEAPELCDNQLDDDCDGEADEGCVTERPCYDGPAGTEGVGICTAGIERRVGDTWGPCQGAVLPARESCGDDTDSDCDGSGGPGQQEDDVCCAGEQPEACNGLDDDCDGTVDEDEVCVHDTPVQFIAYTPSDCNAPGRVCERIIPGDGADFFSIAPQTRAIASSLYAREVDAAGGYYLSRWDTTTDTREWSIPNLVSSGRVAPNGDLWAIGPTVPIGGHRVTHYGSAGNVVCTYDFLGMGISELHVTQDGAIWFTRNTVAPQGMSGNSFRVWRFDPDHAEGSPPQCRLIDLSPDVGGEEYFPPGPGYVHPTPFLLYTETSMDRSETIVAMLLNSVWILDTRSLTYRTAPATTHSMAGPHPLGGFWATSSPSSYALEWLPPDYPSSPVFNYGALFGTNQLAPFAVLSLDQRKVYVEGRYDSALEYDLLTGAPEIREDGIRSQSGLAIDGLDRVWTASATAFARWDPSNDGWTYLASPDGRRLYLNSWATEAWNPWEQRGTWSERFDAGPGGMAPVQLSWQQTLPQSGMVRTTVRLGSTEDELARQLCGPFESSPADLTACPGAAHARYVEVEYVLSAAAWGGRPSVGNIVLDANE